MRTDAQMFDSWVDNHPGTVQDQQLVTVYLWLEKVFFYL
jgi:hypothetical protein